MAFRCRIACVRIGRFAIGALGGRTGEPTALVTDVRGTTRVVATSRDAARRGVEPGMALAQARALAADLVALPWDEERLQRAALEVNTALLQASPRVSWEKRADGQGVWWVDAMGLGDERTLARKLHAVSGGPGYGLARVGVADAAIAAWAASLGMPNGSPVTSAPRRRTRYLVVTPGADAAFLAPFPLTLLELNQDLAGTLHALGIGTVGGLAALTPGEVESRFGKEGLAAHRLALGLDSRGPSTPRDDALPAVELELGGPVAAAEPLLFALKGALAALGGTLRAGGLAAREITLALGLDDGSIAERAVRPARATSHATVLLDHCRAALEDWNLPEPVVSLAVRASLTVPASGEQGDLLAPRWADPAALEAAFDRIRASEGGDAVALPEARDAHLPEDSGTWLGAGAPERRAALRPATGTMNSRTQLAGALRLLALPAPVRVRLGRGGLESFCYDNVWHDVADWSGPERLAPRWWDGAAAGPARDYFSARSRDGALWLLLRAGGKRRAWFVGGWWD